MSGRPLIEFPCAWPVKVFGPNTEDFRASVTAIFVDEAGAGGIEVSERVSRAGTYVSVTVTFAASGEAQLERLHGRLKAVAGVRMVL